MTLDHQHVVIMGGSSGMGLATAEQALREGARVTIAGRSQERLDAAVARLRERLPQADAAGRAADFTDDAALNALFEATGPVDHLVLAASHAAAWGSFTDVSRDALRTALEHKLLGYWATLQAALPVLRRDGSVTMLGGAASRTAIPGTAGLAAVNGAINQMAQTLARELAPLRINVVSPGTIDTPAYDGMPEA
ncbi:MAG: SDR family oxidoreductase, partial [Arenicellales bacterium]